MLKSLSYVSVDVKLSADSALSFAKASLCECARRVNDSKMVPVGTFFSRVYVRVGVKAVNYLHHLSDAAVLREGGRWCVS